MLSISPGIISTGSAALDMALGGGLRSGSLIECLGEREESVTAFVFGLLARSQGEGNRVAIVAEDFETALPTMEDSGVNWEDIVALEPDDALNVLPIGERLVGSRAFGAVVILVSGQVARRSILRLRHLAHLSGVMCIIASSGIEPIACSWRSYAKRRLRRLWPRPSDCSLEIRYDGAVRNRLGATVGARARVRLNRFPLGFRRRELDVVLMRHAC